MNSAPASACRPPVERIADRQHAAADAVARLEDDDLEAGPRERIRGREAREPGADDDDAPSGRPARDPRHEQRASGDAEEIAAA